MNPTYAPTMLLQTGDATWEQAIGPARVVYTAALNHRSGARAASCVAVISQGDAWSWTISGFGPTTIEAVTRLALEAEIVAQEGVTRHARRVAAVADGVPFRVWFADGTAVRAVLFDDAGKWGPPFYCVAVAPYAGLGDLERCATPGVAVAGFQARLLLRAPLTSYNAIVRLEFPCDDALVVTRDAQTDEPVSPTSAP